MGFGKMHGGAVCALVATAVTAFTGVASATVYTDAQNETHEGMSHLDIASVEVTNSASTITFAITTRGPITSPDWGKYLIGLDTQTGGNSNQNQTGNAWSRAISMPGMDYWVGSWVDGGGGAQLSQWTGTSWNNVGTPTHSISGSTLTLTMPLASLGLADGSTVKFDVYTSGGNAGDGANDASSNPNQASSGWNVHYDSGANVSSFTVAVPEPATLAALAGCGVALLRRRRTA